MSGNPVLRSHGIGMTRIVLYDKPDTGNHKSCEAEAK